MNGSLICPTCALLPPPENFITSNLENYLPFYALLCIHPTFHISGWSKPDLDQIIVEASIKTWALWAFQISSFATGAECHEVPKKGWKIFMFELIVQHSLVDTICYLGGWAALVLPCQLTISPSDYFWLILFLFLIICLIPHFPLSAVGCKWQP